MGDSKSGCQGLLLLATLISIEMSRELSQEQLSLLAAFFTALGDDLALLALCPDKGQGCVGTPPSRSGQDQPS